LRITNIQDNIINGEGIAYFEEGDYRENLERYRVKRGDIVVAMSGATTGKIGINKTNTIFYLNQRVGRFDPDKTRINKQYLYHLLLSKSQEIYALAGGGAQPNLSTTRIKSMPVPVPPLPVQEEIVLILDHFTESTTALTVELTAELTARQKQYEYYRDKLLTFKEATP
jgi:type I restriction enzyme S subunit